MIKGVLEEPFFADIRADTNILGRALLDELRAGDASVKVKKLDKPVELVVTGGRVESKEITTVDLQVGPATGPLSLCMMECLVRDGDEEELLPTLDTLREIEINILRMLEDLVSL